MIAGDPHQGGATWAVLQYALGLRRLGHDVVLVEPVKPASIRPAGADLLESINAVYFRDVVASFGLRDTSGLLVEPTRRTVGLDHASLRRAAQQADLLINISGMLTDPDLIGPIPVRLYLDLDPAFVQLWHTTQQVDMRFDRHTHFATVGRNFGRPGCTVPTCGLSWIETRPPVVLQHWPVASTVVQAAFTTVANWRGYGSIEHEGVHYGQKAHSFRRFFTLPVLTSERLAPAINIDPAERADLAALSNHGWHVLDPGQVAGSPGEYAAFVRGSKAELGIAKAGYVAARCGWFSDRSVCYLASGRPVLAQDTGFTDHLPTGEGLLAFSNIDDALHGIETIRSNYARHARAARQVAESYFDSDRVLTALLETVGGSS
jgi:hypothetical protein